MADSAWRLQNGCAALAFRMCRRGQVVGRHRGTSIGGSKTRYDCESLLTEYEATAAEIVDYFSILRLCNTSQRAFEHLVDRPSSLTQCSQTELNLSLEASRMLWLCKDVAESHVFRTACMSRFPCSCPHAGVQAVRHADPGRAEGLSCLRYST